MSKPSRALTRRQALGAAGAVGLGAGAVALTRSTGLAEGITGSTPTGACSLTPEATEGPFHIEDAAFRSDITEGKPGTPLRLDLVVGEAESCRPIPGATVELWHADAAGEYSGFSGMDDTNPLRFLRGAQRADRSGRARFHTIYPGWYEGRTPHVHVKVHVAGDEVHTGQIFFPDELSRAVYRRGAYAARGAQTQTNGRDGIYAEAGGTRAIPRLHRSGRGFVGALTLSVAT